MSVLPSGEQVEIAYGDLRATVVEVGGGLRAMRAGDLDVLDGFGADEMCHDGRGQVLIPWPNRIAGGKYSFASQHLQLALTEPSRGNAIHGLVRWVNWTVESRESSSVTMTHRLHPQTGYPFTLDLAVVYRLSDQGLEVTMRAVNVGADACPFGAGLHLYLRLGTPSVNDVMLRVPARTVHRYDEASIPVERILVEGTPLDFRGMRRIGDTAIDMDYTDLERDGDGRARVLLQAGSGNPALQVWMDEAFPHVTVYTGETVQPPSRRRQSVAVEPMTCPPNAFVSGEDLLVLQAGEQWEGRWGISIETRAGGTE